MEYGELWTIMDNIDQCPWGIMRDSTVGYINRVDYAQLMTIMDNLWPDLLLCSLDLTAN